MSDFYKGENVSFSVEIRRQSDESLFDPSSITITIDNMKTTGDIKVNDQSMTKDSIGVYSYDWTSDETGIYKVIYKAMDGSKVTYKKDSFKII
jgi:hypothetical protein